VGTFVHSLVLMDVASGWTECLAIPVREQTLIVEAITGLRHRLPFPLLGLDTDNDSAFMNDTLWEYCQKHGIVFTRSRAYRKNDQAWVEQKNGAIVRKLIGYGRLEGLSENAALRRLYESSRLYINFFQPSFKLKSTKREGARVHKKDELPETPCRRLLLRDDVSSEIKEALKRQMEPLDPVLKSIREAQDMLMALSKDRTPETATPDASTFVKGLATAWRTGEVRPTHRQEAKPGKHGERGLIPLPQSGRCCLDGWKKDLIWKPNQCLSDCKPAVSANSPTGSYALCSAEYGFGESKSYSNWFTELSCNPNTDQSTSYL
jgi:hypothetical protein